MKITDFGPPEIDQLLNTVRPFNPLIGHYEQHIILPEYSAYSIKLSNGSIRIYVEELQDKQALTQDRLKDIAKRFNERKY